MTYLHVYVLLSLSFIFSSGHWCGCRIECFLDLHLAAAAAVEIQEEQRCGAVINMINTTEQQQLEDEKI